MAEDIVTELCKRVANLEEQVDKIIELLARFQSCMFRLQTKGVDE